MCGRYALGATPAEVAARFGITTTGLAEAGAGPQYNVAPGTGHPVIVGDGTPHLVEMRWGLVPAWAPDPSTRYTMINARSETVAEKPAYRGPLRHGRCLVPATGFYEWQVAAGAGSRAAKQAYHIQVAEGGVPGGLFAFAGLYDRWRGPDGEELLTYTILTTEANRVLQPIHARMPVILPRAAEATWLDPDLSDPAVLLPLLRPYPAEAMVAYPVSAAVNSVAHDGPNLIAPASLPQFLFN